MAARSLTDRLRTIGLWSGPAAALLVVLLVPVGDPAGIVAGLESAAATAGDAGTAADVGADAGAGAGAGASLTPMGRMVLGLMAWMAIWWMTEAIPLAVTALLPLVLLPVAGGFVAGDTIGLADVAPSYANPYIFLFGGGFLLALAMERWGLHRRIALRVLATIGGGPRTVVAAFMGLAAVFSMWVSNTATAVMMLPIALSVVSRFGHGDGGDGGDGGADAGEPGAAGPSDGAEAPAAAGSRSQDGFGRALLLGIAWGCSIGGVGTLIGTPPNALLASFVAQEYPEHAIGFAEWLSVGLPVVLVMLPLAWLLLTRVVERVPRRSAALEGDHLRRELVGLGPTSRPEWSVLVVFMLAATAWITRPLWTGEGSPLAAVGDPAIALVAAIVLFLLPTGDPRHERVLDWDVAASLPWGILLLFGGGLALAGAITRTGVDAWIGEGAGVLSGLPLIVIVLAVVATIVFLTEITSNTATTAAALPVLAALAVALGVAPLMLLAPAAIAASCAFMMPVATPPNAIVFGSGRLAIADMIRAGFLMNLVSIVLVTLVAYGLVAVLLVS